MSLASRFFNQSFFLPAPSLTEKNLADQRGRVAIITGGYAGLGLEVAKIVYQHNGTVYVAGRSPEKAATAISAVKAASPQSVGKVEFLQLDLSDLSTIKASVEDFERREERLDVLLNNAGVMQPPVGSKSAQGYELQIATNCLGAFLFTKLLLPLLQHTADSSPPGSVRVSWAGSQGVDLLSPSPGGMILGEDGDFVPSQNNQASNYGASKAGNVFLATEFTRRASAGKSAIIHNAFNPGNLRTELQRHSSGFGRLLVERLLLYPAVFGAYTELFAGWSEDAGKPERNGAYVIPWGRFGDNRADVEAEKGKEGGKAEKFWEWCERETRKYT